MLDPFHCLKNHLHHWGALLLSNLLSAWAEHEQGHLAVFANKVIKISTPFKCTTYSIWNSFPCPQSSLKYIPPSMCEPHFGQFGAEHIEISLLMILGSGPSLKMCSLVIPGCFCLTSFKIGLTLAHAAPGLWTKLSETVQNDFDFCSPPMYKIPVWRVACFLDEPKMPTLNLRRQLARVIFGKIDM